MKCVVLGVALLMVVALDMAQAQSADAEQLAKQHKEIHEKCAKQSNISVEDAEAVFNQQLPNGNANANENQQCFVKCVLDKNGLLDGDGKLLPQKAVEQIKLLNPSADLAQVLINIEKCFKTDTQNQNTCAITYDAYKCYKEEQIKFKVVQ